MDARFALFSIALAACEARAPAPTSASASRSSPASSPVRVDGISDALEIAVGENAARALRANGEVWCWGGALEQDCYG